MARVALFTLVASWLLTACASDQRPAPHPSPPPQAADASTTMTMTTPPPPAGDATVAPTPDVSAPDAPPAPPSPDAAPSSPPTGGGRHAALIWGYGEHLPTPKATDPLMPLDLTMKARLEAHGLVVDPLVDKASSAADVAGKALIVISNSVDRRSLFDAAGKPKFRDVAVPAIVMKDGVIEVMGMGTGGMGGFSTPVGQTKVTIVAPEDPLAAGLRGDVTVYTSMAGAPCPPCYLKHVQDSDRLIYAFPAAAARTIATIVGNAKQAAIFAYDKGAMMTGGLAAPAKRMGFFIHRDTDYSPDGVKLFDAAVAYLVAP